MDKVYVYENQHGVTYCSHCGYEISCDGCGDMPDYCQGCGLELDWSEWCKNREAIR